MNKSDTSKIHRRKFLGLTGLAIGTLGSGMALPGWKPSQKAKGKIALQLWTVRNLLEKDYAGTIEKVANMGYHAVESIAPPDGMSLKDAGNIIIESGLKVCSAHVDLPKDGKHDWLEMAEAFNCKNMIWHGWPEDQRYKTEDGINELIDIYHQALDLARSNGLKFGLHNHWWEFEKQPSGKLPFEILLAKLDKDIFFEIDTYWVKVAGQNPADIVKKFGDRVKLLHIKDGPARYTESLDADEPEPMVAAGQGTQNFPEIVKAAEGNVEWMIVELDNCATDMMTAVQESYDYLTGNGLAAGRV